MDRKKSLLGYCAALVVAAAISSTGAARAAGVRETPVVRIVRDNSASVVSISTEKIVYLKENPAFSAYANDVDSFFMRSYGKQAPVHTLKLKNVGSGVVLDRSGIIVTNAHVVSMTTGIVVILNDGTQLKGDVRYLSADSDLAIIKIDPPKELKEVTLGTTDDLMVGETVIAIGNPLGLENSVSVGVISGKNRTLYAQNNQPVMSGLIQTDTPINLGNSGGALLNLEGRLLGINTAVVQNSQGIGFAIPVEKVKEVLRDFRENKGRAVDLKAIAASPGPLPQNTVTINNTIDYAGPQFIKEETKDAYLVKMDIQGLDRAKLNVGVNPNFIRISGARTVQAEEKSSGTPVSSSGTSSFSQVIPIPKDADPKAIKAQTKGNALLVIIPKKKTST